MPLRVMAGLVPAISIGKGGASRTEMAGTSPAMTKWRTSSQGPRGERASAGAWHLGAAYVPASAVSHFRNACIAAVSGRDFNRVSQ
jgi:hypothetical protein